jgi:CubicO group peptidase (beta-lactamase class C family)
LNQSHSSPLDNKTAGQDEKFRQAFALLERGIQQRAFPGASVAVTHQGEVIALRGFGRFTYFPFSRRIDTGRIRIYDLASLTKVVATTAMCMKLYEQGKLHLEQPLVTVLPEFASGNDKRREKITFRMLLAHSSGLPAYARLFETAKGRAELLQQAAQAALVCDPGMRADYSDIGFILLGAALEKITAEPLDSFCEREIFNPLGLNMIGFNFPRHPCSGSIPPTERDRSFRHRVVQGEVHDENAWVMGGVAGHAGCFGTAEAVAGFAECMLRRGAPLLQPHTVDLFTQRQASPAGTSRALGWDTPSTPSQSGKYFSRRSYGHLGYTGTSLWIDPERQLSVTLLTNRTWPDRSSQAIKKVRPAFHDAVVEAIEVVSR